jgi:hypothetical protein
MMPTHELAGRGHRAPEDDPPLRSEPLDPLLRSFFEELFGTSFARVQVHGGWFARSLANRFLGITFGEHIFFSRRGWRRYKAMLRPEASADLVLRGIRLVGHELTHTLQARRSGLPVFLVCYLDQWARTGFNYWRIPFEREARANERMIEGLLRDRPGLLASLQGNHSQRSNGGSNRAL